MTRAVQMVQGVGDGCLRRDLCSIDDQPEVATRVAHLESSPSVRNKNKDSSALSETRTQASKKSPEFSKRQKMHKRDLESQGPGASLEQWADWLIQVFGYH